MESVRIIGHGLEMLTPYGSRVFFYLKISIIDVHINFISMSIDQLDLIGVSEGNL